jgi:hypothetical protein
MIRLPGSAWRRRQHSGGVPLRLRYFGWLTARDAYARYLVQHLRALRELAAFRKELPK